MNKVFASILFVMCITIGAFAQESKDILAKDPNYTEIEIVEGKVTSEYLKRNQGTVTIEYLAAYDEARVIYSCPMELFEQSVAMLSVEESIKTFIKERGYYLYHYLRPDLPQYNNEKGTVDYIVFIELLR